MKLEWSFDTDAPPTESSPQPESLINFHAFNPGGKRTPAGRLPNWLCPHILRFQEFSLQLNVPQNEKQFLVED
jgi:hypothetical protein